MVEKEKERYIEGRRPGEKGREGRHSRSGGGREERREGRDCRRKRKKEQDLNALANVLTVPANKPLKEIRSLLLGGRSYESSISVKE